MDKEKESADRSKTNPKSSHAVPRRRRLLAALGSGALLATRGNLPDEWAKPVVETLTLPAHAQTTPIADTSTGFGAARTIVAADDLRLDALAVRDFSGRLAEVILSSAHAGEADEAGASIDNCRIDRVDVYVSAAPTRGNAHRVQVRVGLDACECSVENGTLPAHQVLFEGSAPPGVEITSDDSLAVDAGCHNDQYFCALAFTVDAEGNPASLSRIHFDSGSGGDSIEQTDVPLSRGQRLLRANPCPSAIASCLGMTAPDEEDENGEDDGPCIPDCNGKQCGDDGCEGSCGGCPGGFECVDHICVPVQD